MGWGSTYLLVQDGYLLLTRFESMSDLGEAALELMMFPSQRTQLVMMLLCVGSDGVALFFACGQFELDDLIRSLRILVVFADARNGFLGLLEFVTALLQILVPLTTLSLVLSHAGIEGSNLNLEGVDRLFSLLVRMVVVMLLLLGALNGLAVLFNLLQELFFPGRPRLTLGDNFHPDLLQRRSGAGSISQDLYQGEKLLLGLAGEFAGHGGTTVRELVRGAARRATERMSWSHCSADWTGRAQRAHTQLGRRARTRSRESIDLADVESPKLLGSEPRGEHIGRIHVKV